MKVYGGRWKTLSQIGEGGQAHTFLVQDTVTGAEGFVLKRLKNVTRRNRFDREIDALRRVDSPHVPKVVDIGEHDGKPFLVTLYAGKDLTKTSLPNGIVERLNLFRQAVVAINDAHKVGLVHRDVKPDNVVLDDDGIVRVVDFGICADEEHGAVILTTRVEGFGNRSFAAPECEPGSVDKASWPSDIYSLGKLLYWLMSDRKLIVRERFDATALVAANQHERDYLALLLRRTVAERPESRWNAVELLENIDWVLAKLDEHAEQLPSLILVDTFGPDREFYRHGSKSATTPPHGNPPADHDIAQRFNVGSSDCFLERVEVALRRWAGDGEFELQIVADDEGKPGHVPLVTWHEKVPSVDYVVVPLSARERIQLSASQSYWVTLSATSPGSNIAWWTGTLNLNGVARTTIAKRTDKGPWQPAEASGPGYALLITASNKHDAESTQVVTPRRQEDL